MPRLDLDQFGESYVIDEASILQRIRVTHGYSKMDAKIDLAKHWRFKQGLPLLSGQWRTKASRWGRKLLEELTLYGPERITAMDKCGRLVLTLSRMTLMLADHEVSSSDQDAKWSSDYESYANTCSRDTETQVRSDLKQRLDEHLVRVTDSAVTISHLLPAFETEMQTAINIRALRKPSPTAFRWQNRAVDELKRWQVEHRIEAQGFFAINMASTGKGKTFANAKIIDAINPSGFRYSLALGLRTLTLQTGDEYREKMKLDQAELAILVGSSAVRLLHQQRQAETQTGKLNSFVPSDEFSGSESGESSSSR